MLPRLKAWQWVLLALGGVVAAVAGVWVLRHVPVREIIGEVRAWGPVPFFAALAVLPAVGAPMAPFYLAAGATFPLGVALAGTLIAMSLNIALGYAVARWVLHPPIEKLARRMGYAIPKVRHEDRWMITLLLRITPGPPFCMQSYLLALGRVPFPTYMIVSVPVCGLLAAAFVGVGAGAASGSFVNLIVGLFVLLALIVGVRLGRRFLQRRTQVRVGANGEVEPEVGASSPRGPTPAD